MLRVDGSFQIFDRINDNTYKVDIPSEYGVNAIFNTFLSLFIWWVMIREWIIWRREGIIQWKLH
jgi:hypothetical protein